MRKKLLIILNMLKSNDNQLLNEKKKLQESKKILRNRKHKQRKQTNN